MLLTGRERLALLGILPEHESIDQLRILRELKTALSFSEEEHKKYLAVNAAGQVVYTVDGLKEEVDVKIGEKASDICVAALRAADKAKQLTDAHLEIYDKFIKP
jgi:hypothetical protein